MSDRTRALALCVGLFVVYNANGREIGTYDSQPTKYAARELLLRGTLALNYVVGATPQLIERPAFVEAEGGRYRSAYSPLPSVFAAALSWPLWAAGILDIQAPLGPNWMAKIAASLLTSAAVVMAFGAARRYTTSGRAMLIAIGLGLGTGFWSTVSQTLWQHETSVFGLALAASAFSAPVLQPRHLALLGVGLGIAGAARPQVAPVVLALLAGAVARAGWRRALLPLAIAAASGIAIVACNVTWFGSALGALPKLEALHPRVHATEGTFELFGGGLAGLWISPNRGLLVFSPIVGFAAAGVPAAVRGGWSSPVRWFGIAALAQSLLYGSYTVWWGGHTFGPRYMLDLLPLLVPLAATGLGHNEIPRAAHAAGLVLLSWSMAVAATGAFVFPNERWNLFPRDVDRNHERLWDWSDMQIVRAWRSGASPQNYSLFGMDR